MRSLFRQVVCGSLMSLVIASQQCCSSTGARDTRAVIATDDDIPRVQYSVGTSSLPLIFDDAAYRSLVEKVAADRIALLSTHRFAADAQLAGWYRSIARLYAEIPDFALASKYRAEAAKLVAPGGVNLGRVVFEAESSLARQGLQRGMPGYDDRFRRELRERLFAAPFSEIREECMTWRFTGDVATVDALKGVAQGATDPKLEANGGIASAAVVDEIVNWRQAHRSQYWIAMVGPICGEVLDANAARETRENRWTPRQVSLAPTDPRAPVLIGIWDTGVDADVLGENMWGNAREAINGLDDDSNGYIDDVHGITLTFQGKPRPGTLRDLGPLAPRYGELVDCYVAQADMLRGVDNDGVQQYKARLKTLDPAARFKFEEDVSTVGVFVHGTHVASIAALGNPFARVVAVAYGAPDAAEDDAPPSRESMIAEGETAKRTIDYFRAAGVRIVNMSWQTSRAGLESEMERLGVGGSPAERAALAREWFMEYRSRLESAIRACPEILFVCGAGNSGDDVDFSGYLPAGLRLPNLVAVGAVDAIDRPTSFSSEGSGVSLYALGSDVPGLLPGGRSASFSGTSASAPQVANLAAKMLAIRPQLRPEQVIDILNKTGEAMPDRPGAVVVNPRGAMEAIGWRDRSK